jgi:putative membrane protein
LIRAKALPPRPTLEDRYGEAFDRTFLQAMEAGHEKAIKMLTDASTTVTDEDARAHITATLPGIKQHLEEAKRLQKKPTD